GLQVGPHLAAAAGGGGGPARRGDHRGQDLHRLLHGRAGGPVAGLRLPVRGLRPRRNHGRPAQPAAPAPGAPEGDGGGAVPQLRLHQLPVPAGRLHGRGRLPPGDATVPRGSAGVKFTFSWLKEHLETDATVDQVVDAMTMAGLEVEDVSDPTAALAPFTVARIVSAERHPNADRLQVCQVETVDGMKEIVCGAPNARAGLTTIYAPIGAYVPGLDVTLVEKPVRGVVSNGMLCSAAELQLPGDSDGILDLPDDLRVGAPAAEVFAVEPVIDFEVTPNRPDWLGVAGIARDLAATGLGRLLTRAPAPVPGTFACPVSVRIDAPHMCPVFAGRLIRGVRNGPSPQWLQDRLTAIGLRPINALVDITNLISYDRARPLHVYDA